MLVRFLVANRFPHVLWCGPDYVQFYKDPYRSTRHSAAFPQRGTTTFSEAGFNGHLVKPVTFDAVLALLQSMRVATSG
jgi:hypothetical protein